jgi:hypothetical protein
VPGLNKLIAICRCLILLFCIMGISGIVRGQCTFSTRRYANTEVYNAGLLTSVTSDPNAADGNPATSSALYRAVGVGNLITVTQFLSFPSQVTSGTPVTIKVNLPAALISLLGGVSIQPFTGLHNVLGTNLVTAVGSATSVSSLVGVANGAGDMELTITPTGNYDGVSITMSGIAVGQSMNLFDAYVMQSSPTQYDCGTAVDVLAGTRAAIGLSIANATGGVDNPTNAIDNSTSTYAQLNVGAQVLSEAYLTTIFNTPSQPGDVVRMILQNVSGGLVNLGLISNFTIQLYNGSTAVGSPIQSSSSNLTLTALTGTSVSDQYQLDIKSLPTDGAFDRVDVQIGGVAAVGTALRIYDIKRIPAAPVVTMNGTVTSSQTVCQGSTSTLVVSNPQTSCTTYTWYNVATGGTPLTTGTTYAPPAAGLSTGANTYYVQASRSGCTEVSDRIPVVINVNPAPTFSSSSTPRACKGTVTANMPYTATNAPTTYSIVWDAAALTAGFVNVTDATLPTGAITVAVPAGAAVGTYNGTLTVKNGTTTCGSSAVPFSVIVDGKPTQPVLTVAN